MADSRLSLDGAAGTRWAFGGPDRAPRLLRDLLQDQVDAAPPGSAIDWATYYFRDRALADALIRASDRGVQVRLVLEARPRQPWANDAVAGMLREHGLRGGFALRDGRGKGSLHTKIYCFSNPGIAWVGSFNPSGDAPEVAAIIAEIGDQDRGDNLLVGFTDPTLVSALTGHVRGMSRRRNLFDRFRPSFNRIVAGAETQLYFYPRLRPLLVEPEIARLRRGDRVQGAVSHLKSGPLVAALTSAARNGAAVALIVHDTKRRVPAAVVDQLRGAGVTVTRRGVNAAAPMHAKFLCIERGDAAAAWFGSLNFNKRSRRHNDEVLVRSADPDLFAALQARFEQLAGGRPAAVRRWRSPPAAAGCASPGR
jgi:hypothetical protein